MYYALFTGVDADGDPEWIWNPDTSKGWRVCFVDSDDEELCFSLIFGTHRDAEAAANALNATGLDAITDLGPQRVRQIMLEALAW